MNEATRKSVAPAPTRPALSQLHPAMPGQQGQRPRQLSADGEEAPSTEANRCWELQKCGSDRADFYQDILKELQTRLLEKCSLQQHKMPACQDPAPPLPRHSPLRASAPHHTRLCLSALRVPSTQTPLTQHWLLQTKTR